jgi:hypothetical protein
MLNYLNKNSILSENQYGFRKNHSTSLALVDLYDKIALAIDQKIIINNNNRSINNNNIRQVTNITFLGIVLDQFLTWSNHLDLITKKLSNVQQLFPGFDISQT